MTRRLVTASSLLLPLLRAASLVTMLVLGSCAVTEPTPATHAVAPLVWPPAPDEARILFVQSFARPLDLGIERGFFQRVVDFIFGDKPGQLVRPAAVLEVDHVLYVADPGVQGVHRFDRRERGRYDLLGKQGGLALPSPVGLARGENGGVYVTDSALGGVYLIQPGAEYAQPVVLASKLGQPTGIAFDTATRRLYVTDTSSHQIKVFTPEGALIKTIGQRGNGDGEFNFPTMLWCSPAGDRLFVTDSLNFRTQILDLDGRFIGKFGKTGDGSGDLPRPKGVATDRKGHVYLVDGVLHGMQVFDEAGQLLLAIGALGKEPGEFRLPMGIFIGTDDTIYVADTYNQRVQVFRYVGSS